MKKFDKSALGIFLSLTFELYHLLLANKLSFKKDPVGAAFSRDGGTGAIRPTVIFVL
jgi:hypothetical protein